MATCPTCKTTYPDTMRLCPTDGTVLEGGQAPKDDNVGRSLDGKYRLDERLSSGGMGTVYKATHLMLGKQLAVKLIKADLPASPDVVRRFQREAKAASALNHPNIAPAYDLGQTQDGTLYIAMEFVDGPSLKQVIQAGPIPPARTIAILKQVASALALAHKHEIIHRDLKPQNIMLTKDGDGREVAKLLDFGIAKTLDDTATQLTATGFSLGTPQYMSPEQAYGRPVDGRSDLYSLGIILYEMLVGEVPFSDPSTPAVLVKQMTEAPVPPALKRPDLQISPALAAVALKCLEKDPAQRYQTAEEFSAALDTAAATIGGSALAAAQAAGIAAVDESAAATMLNKPTQGQTTRLPTPAPIPVVSTPGAPPSGPSNQTTAVVGAGAPTTPIAAAASPAPSSGAPTLVSPKPAADDKTILAAPGAAAAAAAAAVPPAAPAKPAPASAAAKSGGGSRVAVAAVVAILLLGGAAYGAFRMGLIGGAKPAVQTAAATPSAPAPATDLATAAVPAATTPATSATPADAPAAAAGAGAPPNGGAPPAAGASSGGGNGSNGAPANPPAPPAAATPPPVPSGPAAQSTTHTASASAATTKTASTSAPAGRASTTSASSGGSSASASTGAADGPARSQPQTAPAAALPVNPSVAFSCDGAPDICGALKSALNQALAKDSMTSVRDAARADVAVGATVTLVDEQTQKMFGNTFTIRNYTIDVNGEARRAGEDVPMPSSTTLNYDQRYRDRLDEKARLVAASVVESVREYWKKK